MSASFTFIDVWKEGWIQTITMKLTLGIFNLHVHAGKYNRHVLINFSVHIKADWQSCVLTCAVETISLISTVADTVITASSINTVSIPITPTEPIYLTLIDI